MIGLGSMFLITVSASPNPIAHYNINSRFILWDNYEKMIDNNFQIEFYSFNQSSNFTSSYYIQINSEIRNGTFQYYHYENYILDIEYETFDRLLHW